MDLFNHTDFEENQDSISDAAPLTHVPQNHEYEGFEQFDFTEFFNAPINFEELTQETALLSDPTFAYDPDDFVGNGLHEHDFYMPSDAYLSPLVKEGSHVQQLEPIPQVFEPVPAPPHATLTPADDDEKYVYRNNILNGFKTPVDPLRVIDQVQFPFEEKLQVALEVELNRQEELEITRALKEALQHRPAAKTKAGKVSKNKRPSNIKNFNSEKYYKPLKVRPASWGPHNPETGELLYQYNAFGELNPNTKFTTAQFSEYLAQNPGHYLTGRFDTRNSGLTIWLQIAPADSSNRYPAKESGKCRFLNCPVSNNTIHKGTVRVCLDELAAIDKQEPTDPFHNAGYVHLFCLEKNFDFPQICKDFNVKPDTRKIPEGKNKMALTRDHPSMEDVAWDYIKNSKTWPEFSETGVRPTDYYEYTLCYKLNMEHLVRQPRHVQSIRDDRAGNSLDVHKGNLDVYAANEQSKQRKRHTSMKETKPRKRKAAELEENDSGLDSRPVKRAR